MKALLVIDMPKSCAECTLRTSLEANYLYCIATLPRLKIDPMTAHLIKEHKCPLKPIPNEACEKLVQGLDAMEKMKSVEVRVVRRTE